MVLTEFQAPGKHVPLLAADRVHVWRVRLDQDEATTARMQRLLSGDELARAARFHFPHLRTHYVAARAALRLLCGAQTGTPAQNISFAYTQNEKPFLPGAVLRFNVSHAHTVGLLAFALDREIGVDIEYVRDRIDAGQIALRYFSPAEISDFLSVANADRQQAFYNGWTRKEAYIKAIGDGLTFPLDRFRVSLIPGEPARLIEVDSAPTEAARWKMAAIDPGPGYTAALIAEGQDWEPELWDFVFPDLPEAVL